MKISIMEQERTHYNIPGIEVTVPEYMKESRGRTNPSGAQAPRHQPAVRGIGARERVELRKLAQ